MQNKIIVTYTGLVEFPLREKTVTDTAKEPRRESVRNDLCAHPFK